ncbi:hypothetical protein HAX54_043555 [Datura stramonium]|uniref:Uncharacterized protein n=1 Tax=Datura stramonium TaxID=4076 RepID=A0ABS8W4V4_DATST|nr:hypothetical protein [Datura stramonium]
MALTLCVMMTISSLSTHFFVTNSLRYFANPGISLKASIYQILNDTCLSIARYLAIFVSSYLFISLDGNRGRMESSDKGIETSTTLSVSSSSEKLSNPPPHGLSSILGIDCIVHSNYIGHLDVAVATSYNHSS